MISKPDRIRTALIALFVLLNLGALAQIRIISPYSRFGLGDLADNNNAWNLSSGQLGIGIRNPLHVNFSNPASYTAFDSLSFIFEGGIAGEFVTLRSDLQSANRNYASLGNLLFGIPVTRWWKTSLGLIPFSDVGYNVVDYSELQNAGTVARLYSGSGGLSRLYWGHGFRPWKNFSVGANVSYLFGSLDREAVVLFPDSIHSLNVKETFHLTLSDLYYTFGAQYTLPLRNDLNLTMGAVFAPTLSLSAKTDNITSTFLITPDGVETPRDTLVNSSGQAGQVVIPMYAGGGVSIEKPGKWMAGADFKWQNWEKFRAFGRSDSLVNSWNLNLGGEFIPDPENYNRYFSRVHYRMGFTYGKTYLRLRDQELNEYSVTLGFGLPLRGTKTMLNVGAQYGVRGTTVNGLIRENYFKIVVGFSINERWFVKRKYF